MRGPNTVFREAFCPKCGKLFIPAPEHVFKVYHPERNRTDYYCCWTCYNHRDEGKVVDGHSKNVIQTRTDGVDIKLFKNANQAGEIVGAKPEKIREACRKGTVYAGYLWRFATND